jgi:hypothetical protein
LLLGTRIAGHVNGGRRGGDDSDHDAFNERLLRLFAFPNVTTWGTLQRIISRQDRNGAGNG